MATRFGLQQLSTSARNSPFGTEKAFDGKAKPVGKIEPLKISAHKKYLPVIPSPLATSPFLNSDNKENAMTQTPRVEKLSCPSQTMITISEFAPKITVEDLSSEEPTANYYRVMADRMTSEIAEEVEKNVKLCRQLGDIKEEINKVDRDLEILREVIEEMEEHSGDEDEDEDLKEEGEIGCSQL